MESRTHSKPVSRVCPPGTWISDVAFRGRLWPIKGSRFQQPGPNEARRRGSSLSSCGMLGRKWRRDSGRYPNGERARDWLFSRSLSSWHSNIISRLTSWVTCLAVSSQWDLIDPNCLSVPLKPRPPLDQITQACVWIVWLYLYVFVPPQGNVNEKHVFYTVLRRSIRKI